MPTYEDIDRQPTLTIDHYLSPQGQETVGQQQTKTLQDAINNNHDTLLTDLAQEALSIKAMLLFRISEFAHGTDMRLQLQNSPKPKKKKRKKRKTKQTALVS